MVLEEMTDWELLKLYREMLQKFWRPDASLEYGFLDKLMDVEYEVRSRMSYARRN